MCYTIQTSIVSLKVGIVGCISLLLLSSKTTDKTLKSNFRMIGLFFIFVSIMQFYDAIFWKTQSLSTPQNIKWNKLATKFAIITNHLQPLILAFIIYVNSKSLGKWSKLILALYTISIMPYTIQCFTSKDTQTTTVRKESSGSLYWAWNHQPGGGLVYLLYLLSLVILFMENIQTSWIKWTAVSITIFSFLFTMLKHERLFRTGGRFWCYFGSFLVWSFIFIYFIKRLKKNEL